jgi:hypothetical protein
MGRKSRQAFIQSFLEVNPSTIGGHIKLTII